MRMLILAQTLAVLMMMGCGSNNNSPKKDEMADSQIIPDSPTEIDPQQAEQNPSEEAPEEPQVDDLAAKAMTDLVNALRSVEGLSSLVVSEPLSFGAEDWSKSQLKQKRISHDGFPEQRYQAIGEEFPEFNQFIRAENVAAGYPRSTDPKVVAQYFFDLWLASPGHKKNMVGDHNAIGYGIAIDQSGRTYGTQLFF